MDSIDQDYRTLLEDDNSLENAKAYTGDGSVCIFGYPASKKHTGNWKACSLTLVCNFCSYLAFSSITKNLVSYLKESLHETNVTAARSVLTWQGISYLAPLVGAFIADSYLGNYWTILIFGTIFVTIATCGIQVRASTHGRKSNFLPSKIRKGMLMLILSAAIPSISTGLYLWFAWIDTVSTQHIIFYVGLYMVAIGFGAQDPCITSFGADQFDHTDKEERNKRSSFFNWLNFILNVASLISGTIIVWVQDHEGWLWGFSIAALFVALGLGSFLFGSTVYRFQKPGGSPVARVCQVIVAATCNFNYELPCDRSLLYELPGQGLSIEGSKKLKHTDGLEFFDKAAIVTSSDCESVALHDKCRICTVTQVEELKILIRMLPIWVTMVLFSAVIGQMYSTFIEQGMVMDAHIGSFKIPAASFQIVDVIAVLLLVPIYEKVLVPVLRNFTVMANGITPLQRMGISLIFSMLSMVSAALVEGYRLQIARAQGSVNRKVAVPVSILWQGPQYFLLGAGEVFAMGLFEFFYEESPDTMRSLCLAFSFANESAGYYISSLIISLVPVFTARGGNPGWIPDNLNEGHLDRFYWMMAGLSLVNLLAFVFFAMRYKSKKAL